MPNQLLIDPNFLKLVINQFQKKSRNPLIFTIKIINRVHPYLLEKYYVYNIVTTNPKWQVVIDCYC